MLKIYGSMQCPDCVQCREDLDRAGTEYEFVDILENLRDLKAFLRLRDVSALFDGCRREGLIGIPCLVWEDGSLSLDWDGCLPHRPAE